MNAARSHHPQRRSTQQGFTLLEMLIVIGLMLVLVGSAVLSFASLEETNELKGPIEKLRNMAKYANRAAVVQGSPVVIAFNKDGFGVMGGDAGDLGNCSLPKDMKLNFTRWNGGRRFMSTVDLNWVFFPTGICEPYTFQFVTPDGTTELDFNPLTGSVRREESFTGRRR
jgi:prepilin-type N-terminal cleavage/methylation domain-containing protein